MRNRVRLWDEHVDDDFKSIYNRLEEKLSDADWRSIGGFRTEDQKFAFEMREILKETLTFLERMDELVDRIVSDMQGTIDEVEAERDDFEDKLERVRIYVEEQQKLLRRLEEILDS